MRARLRSRTVPFACATLFMLALAPSLPFIPALAAAQGRLPPSNEADEYETDLPAHAPPPPADSLGRTGPIPFAKMEVREHRGRGIDLGIGARSYSSDLSGLSEVYGRSLSSRFHLVLSVSVECDVSTLGGILLDGGVLIASGGSGGYHGLLGLIFYPPPLSKPGHRVFVSGGLSSPSIRYEASDLLTTAGRTGWYAGAGWEKRLAPNRDFQLFAAYCSSRRVSTTYAGMPASMNLSSVTAGFRFKWHPSIWSALP